MASCMRDHIIRYFLQVRDGERFAFVELAGLEDARRYAPLYRFEHLVGENIHRYPMTLTSLECQVSELVNSDACPRPTTGSCRS